MSDNHGNTPAAWTAVLIALVGFLIGSVAMLLSPVNWIIFAVGTVVTLAGLLMFAVQALRGSSH